MHNTITDHYDLLVVPQRGTEFPAPYFTEDQAQHVIADWAKFGNETIDNPDGHWVIATAHIIDGETSITSYINIPRSPQQVPNVSEDARPALSVIHCEGGGNEAVSHRPVFILRSFEVAA